MQWSGGSGAAASGEQRRLTGVCRWDYTGRSPLVVDGVTRFDYAPLWELVGLGLERLQDGLSTAPLVWVHAHA